MTDSLAASPTGLSGSPAGKLHPLSGLAVAARSTQTADESSAVLVLLRLVQALQTQMLSGDARYLAYADARERAVLDGVPADVVADVLRRARQLGRRERAEHPCSSLF